MSGGRPLAPPELRFISLVAARRFGGEPGSDADLEAASAEEPGEVMTAASSLAARLLRGQPSGTARATALLALWCRLSLDGYELIAPQGAVAGMVQGLADGRVDVGTVAHWLDDRAVSTDPRA